jgi:SAM-dependent methyltransferase
MDCAWCGSMAIDQYMRSPDIVQHKPGTFTLDRCRDCSHIFQNPQPSVEGLDFYYRDTYDGLGAKSTEVGFSMATRDYKRRAKTLLPYAKPETWLDIGTGYGHFCKAAKQIWPETSFSGLDQGNGVQKALDRGWIDKAHQGFFTEIADKLAGRYDVLSMHHYLEHTLDPIEEIRAAAQVLDPGGYLQIEVPDPECIFASLFGRRWFQWMQPQHLHMISSGNLSAALGDNGFTVVTVERKEADLGKDFAFAAAVVLNAFAPIPNRAWAPRDPTIVDYAKFVSMWIVAIPILAGAFILDNTVRRLLPRRTNAYRIIAQRV